MELGTVVRETQVLYGMTNESLGRLINYSPEMVSKMKSGSRKVPLDAIPRLAELSPRIGLNCTLVFRIAPNQQLAWWGCGSVDPGGNREARGGRGNCQRIWHPKLVNKTCKERLSGDDQKFLKHIGRKLRRNAGPAPG